LKTDTSKTFLRSSILFWRHSILLEINIIGFNDFNNFYAGFNLLVAEYPESRYIVSFFNIWKSKWKFLFDLKKLAKTIKLL